MTEMTEMTKTVETAKTTEMTETTKTTKTTKTFLSSKLFTIFFQERQLPLLVVLDGVIQLRRGQKCRLIYCYTCPVISRFCFVALFSGVRGCQARE